MGSAKKSDVHDPHDSAPASGPHDSPLAPDAESGDDTDKVLTVDSAAAALGGAFSASSNTTYIESALGSYKFFSASGRRPE